MRRNIFSNRWAKIARIALFCLLALFSGNPATAQESVLKSSEYSYRRYTTDDGLPSSFTDFLYQDSKGFIWIGSDAGFSRYDGFTFTNYLTGKFANITRINENSKGEIRAFSHIAMFTVDAFADTLRAVYADSDYYTFPIPSRDLPPQYGIFATRNDNRRDFMELSDDGFHRMFTNEDVSRFKGIYYPYVDTLNKIIYLPLSDGIQTLSLQTGKRIAFYNNVFAHCFVMLHDTLCAVALDGIYRLENGSFKQFVKFNLKEYDTFYMKAITDIDGNLLIMDSQHIFKLKNQQLDVIFNADNIRDILCDTEGNLWVATENGLYCLFRLQFKNYHLQTDNNRITLAAVVNGKLLAGTEKGDLFYVNDNAGSKSFVNVKTPLMTSIHWNDNTLFITAKRDVLQLMGKRIKPLNLPMFTQYENDSYNLINKTPNGNLIAGGERQLVEFSHSGKVIAKYSYQYLLQPIEGKPCYDSQGNLWICGPDGISKCTPEGKVSIIKNNSFHICMVMINDNDQNVWFGSENRLCKVEGDSAKVITQFKSMIRNIYFTKNNILIVATTDGIYLSKNNDFNHFVAYNHENGYTGKEALIGNIVEDSSGNVYLPSMDALVSFNPQQLFIQQFKPKLNVQSISVSPDNINWQKADMSHLKFNYKVKNIRMNYIGLSYSQAQNVRYHYRLLGFQNDWSAPVKNREVTFNNLPPGNYTFEIYADSETDESRSETQSFTFSIKPALWQTAWFLVACIAFLMLASAGIALYVQRRKNKALLEKLRAEKELNELRISSIRLKAIPHFNANVLAAIEYYIANRTREEAMRILGIYSDFTFKTLSDVDKAARPLSEELTYVKMYLDLEKIRFLDKFDFKINVDKNVDEDVQLPNMILHTYCENAVKHGLMPLKSGGILAINVSQRDRIVFVSVEDNGVGRDNAGKNPYIHSTKQGLSILNRQIEIYNSFNHEKINSQVKDLFESGKPSGTRFTVEVPLDFEYGLGD